jgi:hypothetical protein
MTDQGSNVYSFREGARRVLAQADKIGLSEESRRSILDEHIRESVDLIIRLREEATREKVIAILEEWGYVIVRPKGGQR